MGIKDWFFKSKMKKEDIAISRGAKAVEANKGKELETFLSHVSAVVGRKPEEINLDADLQEEYGCDELDVLECIQIAEDCWSVSILKNPMEPADIENAMQKLKTLNRIIQEAEKTVG